MITGLARAGLRPELHRAVVAAAAERHRELTPPDPLPQL
jgi:hypothetical protein